MKKNYLKWWLQNVVVLTCCGIASYFGVVKDIYQKDYSYLCFVIFGLYVCFSFINGWIAYSLDSGKQYNEKDLESSWFVSELCLSLGMIGTVVGFIGMLQGFSGNTEGAKALQKLLSDMSYGMSTALYTTLAGLIFGNLLKVQCFHLEKNIGRKKCQDTEIMEPKQVS